MKRKYIWFVLGFLITMFIFKNSLKNATESSSDSMKVLNALSQFASIFSITLSHKLVRKLAHICEFSAQSFCFENGFYSKSNHRHFLYSAFIGLLTAVVDEYLQSFSNGRSPEVRDICIDFFGTILAIVFVLIIKKAFHKECKNADNK